jgi:hypothetical protein
MMFASALVVICADAAPYLTCNAQRSFEFYKIEIPAQHYMPTHWEQIVNYEGGGSSKLDLKLYWFFMNSKIYDSSIRAGGMWTVRDMVASVQSTSFQWSKPADFQLKFLEAYAPGKCKHNRKLRSR